MLENISSTNRYSDKELAEFKNHIELKLESANKQISYFRDRLEDITSARDNEGDSLDDSSNIQDMEMLYSMINRQQKHIRDLENALIRIRTKSYGICIITGQLIDKKRLFAVPTTTKCLAAKLQPVEKITRNKIDQRPKVTKPNTFSRVIKTSPEKSKDIDSKSNQQDIDNFDLTDDYEDNLDLNEVIDESYFDE